MKSRDIDIRESLHYALRKQHIDEKDTLILNELGVCQGEARIDIAVINGTINGFEIKSESDTLERLPKQTALYNKIFDTITIVTGEKHLCAIKDIVPNWWGILCAEMDSDRQVHLSSIRKARENKKVDPFSLAQLLWKEEALDILIERGLQRGYLSKPRSEIWKAVATKLPLNELQYEVRCKLKARQGWRVH